MKLCHKSLPGWRVIEFACAIFKRIHLTSANPSPPSPAGEAATACTFAGPRGEGPQLSGGPDSDRWNIEGSLAAVPCAAYCFVLFSVPSALTDPLSQEDPVERSSYRSPRFSHSCRQNTVTYRCLTEPLGTKVGIISGFTLMMSRVSQACGQILAPRLFCNNDGVLNTFSL